MITLRPRIFGFRNDLLRRSQGKRRVLIASLLVIGMGWVLFNGTHAVLREVPEGAAVLDENLVLSFLNLLFVILFFSGATRGLASLYLSRDNELYLAAPLSPWKFYSGRIAEICLETLWSIVVLGAPIIAAVSASGFKVLPFIASIPALIFQPILLGVIATTIVVNIVPAAKLREIALCLLFLSIGVGSVIIISQSGSHDPFLQKSGEFIGKNLPEMGTLKAIFPTTLAAGVVTSSIKDGSFRMDALLMLWGECFFLYTASLLVLGKLHLRGYTLSLASEKRGKPVGGDGISILSIFPPQIRAMVGKEIKLLIREPSQALQFAFFLFVCLLYMYNLREIAPLSDVPENLKNWGRLILVSFNLTVAGFITAAVATRFAYLSSSIEGGSFYIIQSSPISLSKFLYSKFALWSFIIGLVSIVVGTSGALALGVSPRLVILTALVVPCWTLGIVGLSIGLGSVFARFDWDNASQLSFSIGALVTMLATTGLVIANALGVTLLVAVSNSPIPWIAYAGLFLALTLIANIAIANLSLQAGVRALGLK